MPACNTFVFIYQCDVAILDAGSDWTWIDRLGIERDYCSVCIWRHFSECYVNNGSRRDFVWLPISWVLLQIPQPKRFFSRENFVYFENCNLLLLLRFDDFFFQFTIYFPKNSLFSVIFLWLDDFPRFFQISEFDFSFSLNIFCLVLFL